MSQERRLIEDRMTEVHQDSYRELERAVENEITALDMMIHVVSTGGDIKTATARYAKAKMETFRVANIWNKLS